MTNFKVYNHVNCTIFDLIGKMEPAQTKALGYVLSQSSDAMRVLLSLIYHGAAKQVNDLLQMSWDVRCEMPLTSGRADIVLTFRNIHTVTHVIVIEAKNIAGNTNPLKAVNQIKGYASDLQKLYGLENVTQVTLTNRQEFVSGIVNVTWFELVNELQTIVHKNLIINELITYLTNFMNYYDVEVLCIPAGNTIATVRKHGIYECPTTGRQFKKRGTMRPLYVCFRERGHNGRFDTLYKVQDVVAMDMNDALAVDALDRKGIYTDIKNRICGYVKDVNPLGEKFVFILDFDHSIKLPQPVEFASTRGMAGHVILTLKEVLDIPCPGVITLQPKKITH